MFGGGVTRISRLPKAIEVITAGAAKAVLAGAEAATADKKQQIEAEIKSGRQWPNLPNVSSAPGEAPANQFGHLLKGIQDPVIEGEGLNVSAKAATDTGDKIPEYLEAGTNRIQPRPFEGPSFVPGVEAAHVSLAETHAEVQALEI